MRALCVFRGLERKILCVQHTNGQRYNLDLCTIHPTTITNIIRCAYHSEHLNFPEEEVPQGVVAQLNAYFQSSKAS